MEGNSSATVSLVLEAFETKTISKRVTTIGMGEGFSVTLSTNSVNIVVSGPQSALDEITEESITAEIDLTGLQPGEYELTPKIVLPVDMIEVSVNPLVISVTITVEGEEELPPEQTPAG